MRRNTTHHGQVVGPSGCASCGLCQLGGCLHVILSFSLQNFLPPYLEAGLFRHAPRVSVLQPTFRSWRQLPCLSFVHPPAILRFFFASPALAHKVVADVRAQQGLPCCCVHHSLGKTTSSFFPSKTSGVRREKILPAGCFPAATERRQQPRRGQEMLLMLLDTHRARTSRTALCMATYR